MYGDERLRKLDRAYGIFNVFQIVTLTAGTLSAIFMEITGSPVLGWVFFLSVFGGTVAFILFGIITANLTDHTMKKRYPDVKPRKSFSVSKFGFNYSEDLNGPMKEKAQKTHDQLVEDVYKKSGRIWIFAILNAVVPSLLTYVAAGLLAQ